MRWKGVRGFQLIWWFEPPSVRNLNTLLSEERKGVQNPPLTRSVERGYVYENGHMICNQRTKAPWHHPTVAEEQNKKAAAAKLHQQPTVRMCVVSGWSLKVSEAHHGGDTFTNDGIFNGIFSNRKHETQHSCGFQGFFRTPPGQSSQVIRNIQGRCCPWRWHSSRSKMSPQEWVEITLATLYRLAAFAVFNLTEDAALLALVFC